MKIRFHASKKIHASAQDVFHWHQHPCAFERLLPPWSGLKKVSGAGIQPGGQVTLRFPIGYHWHFKHEALKKGLGFADRQTKGPFKSWYHQHVFEEMEDGSCKLHDKIEAELPLPIDPLKRHIERELLSLVRYRERTLNADFACIKRLKSPLPRGKILITGASGTVGSALSAFLKTQGCQVVPLRLRVGEEASVKKFLTHEGPFEAVVNLCGESVLKRWTPKTKERIRSSRVDLTQFLCETLKELGSPPKCVISASGVGYYGIHSDQAVTEHTPSGTDGFLTEVSKAWEWATEALKGSRTRVVTLRMAAVMSPAGGFLRELMLPFKAYMGGYVGAGSHHLSWISIDDLIYLIAHILTDEAYQGPINAVAPEILTHETCAQALGERLKRPVWLRTPPVLFELIKGKGITEEILLADMPARPQKALDLGFQFTYPTLNQALAHLLP